MKRLISLFLCLILVLGLFAGCGEDEKETQPTGTQATVETEPAGEYTLDRESGKNQITFYWLAEGTDLSKCDMWIWYENSEARGYRFHKTDRGGKVVLNIPESVSEVGFVVRKNCSEPGGTSWGEAVRDVENDRFVTISEEETTVWLKPGDSAQYISSDGGKTLVQAKVLTMVAIETLNQIRYNITTPARFTSLSQVKVTDGSREVPISSMNSLNDNASSGVITLGEELDLSKSYTLELEGYDPRKAVPTKVFDTDAFINRYTYDGDDLGATIQEDETVFKLWAPTASQVRLELYQVGNGGNTFNQISMTKGEKGVWSATVKCGHGTYYSYAVTTSQGTQKVVDPYAKAVGVNGDRAMVVDLAATDPEGFAEDSYFNNIKNYNEAIIWEVHVRDFSNKISRSQYPGKYLAFTETGLKNASGQRVGLDYLKSLGITHVQLQPIFDFNSIDETASDGKFNWGYDPKNFNVPEGSYSTDPFHGEVRINEVKQMVQALHSKGIGVVMDVAYNHTYDINSNLNKIVPYYYYRYTAAGSPSNGSGAGNETASDRVMFRKFMVDSVTYWAKEYHIDGFRFDKMALHDIETMQAVEKAIHEVNPKALIYGDGTVGGSTVLSASLQASAANINQIEATGIGGVAVFNDTTRDALIGSIVSPMDQGYINGKANSTTAGKVMFCILGGQKTNGVNWSVDDNMVINYMASHNYSTLWDKLKVSNSSANDEGRFAMYRLGEEILMISKGAPFILGGEEFLRSKNGDRNSYKSSDTTNNIDWNTLSKGSMQMRMRDLVRELIALRKSNSFFTGGKMSCEVVNANVIRITWTVGKEMVAVALINPNDETVTAQIPSGNWELLFSGSTTDGHTISGKDMIILTLPGVGVKPVLEDEPEPVEDPEATGEEATGEEATGEEVTGEAPTEETEPVEP